MVKFKKLWLFERSEFQSFLNFIIDQRIAGIRHSPFILSSIQKHIHTTIYFFPHITGS